MLQGLLLHTSQGIVDEIKVVLYPSVDFSQQNLSFNYIIGFNRLNQYNQINCPEIINCT